MNINTNTIHNRNRNTAAMWHSQLSEDTNTRYPKTVFVFNSLLRTRFAWLNKEVDLFNRCMFDFSLENHNFWFFDSHHICSVIFNNGFEILDSSGNGIHITQLPKSEIANCLVTGVQKLSMRSEKVRKHWPLRREFVSLLRGN